VTKSKGELGMLGVSSYKKDYVEECRKAVAAQLSAYRNLIETARKEAGAGNKAMASAIGSFTPGYFNSLVLALDHLFLHRLRTRELKDGNALNEVRMLCNSIMEHEQVMTEDTQIKYDPARSISKIKIGEKISMDEEKFARLASGFFDEIEKKYP